MYEKLLVAVDGYAPSLGAAKRAVEMAAQQGSEVIVLQVEEELPLLPAEKNAEAAALEADQRGPITANPLDLVTTYGKKHGVNVKAVKETGRIVASILRVAKDHGVDLVVIGDSGRKGLQKLYFGSVAQAVAENSYSPVLIVKKDRVDISDMVSLLSEAKDVSAAAVAPLAFRPEVFRKNLIFAGSLFAVFAIMYFGAALLTSAPFKETAALDILGLPLGIWAGWTAIVGGVVIVRIYLTRGGEN